MGTKVPIRPRDAKFMHGLFKKNGTNDDFIKAVYKSFGVYLKAVDSASNSYKKALDAAGKKLDRDLEKLKK
jgi:ribosome-associated translation inhibitor RaiA